MSKAKVARHANPGTLVGMDIGDEERTWYIVPCEVPVPQPHPEEAPASIPAAVPALEPELEPAR